MNKIYKTGGGCRPIGINHKQYKYVPLTKEQIADIVAKREAERAAWLKSPEGIANTARLVELERLAKEQAIKKAEETTRRLAWNAKYSEIKSNPLVGTIIHSPTYSIHIEENAKRIGEIIAYSLLRIKGAYPDEPRHEFGYAGRHGLKVLLSAKSREWIISNNENVVSSVLRYADELRQLAKHRSERSIDDYYDIYGHELTPDHNHDIIYCTLPIRIIGVSESGKSAQGELVQ